MRDAQDIVAATPVLLLLIGIEWLVGLRRGRNTCRLNDALNSIGLGILSQLAGVFSKLGAFDRWFCSPSNHRAHHAVNDRYLDRNYGGILIVWDRLFGTFVEEDDAVPCVYGTRSPLRSWNPLWANLQVYADLLRDSWHAAHWTDKLRVWLAPPGWRPADVAARFPKPPFVLQRFRRFDPPAGRGAQALAGALFLLLLGATMALLWTAHTLGPAQRGGAAAAIVAGLWLVGVASEGRRGSSVSTPTT
jgi:alkylglycerol monooxygenase